MSRGIITSAKGEEIQGKQQGKEKGRWEKINRVGVWYCRYDLNKAREGWLSATY